MIPNLYQPKENRPFKPWIGGNVTNFDLSKYSPDQDTVFINGIMVYSLSFKVSANQARVWNCKYGWERKGML